MLQIDGAYVSLDPEADFRLDVAVLETAFNSVRGIAAARLHRQQARMLESAVALYTGHLLEGWLQDWCIYQRERLQSMYLAIMEKLMTYCELRGRYEAGVAYGERILAHDRGREQTYLKMMRLHYEAGDRAGALRQFQRCVTALQEELNVEPSKETCSLYEQIRTDELKLESWGLEHSEIDPQRGPVASLTGRLCKLRSILLKLNKRVKDDLKEIDHALSVGLDGPRQAKRYSHNPH
jgi:DNA-binding SARP family transcriptional activator